MVYESGVPSWSAKKCHASDKIRLTAVQGPIAMKRFQTPDDDALYSVDTYLRFSDEALALRITEKFLSELGRTTMRYTHEMFDVSAIRKLLGEIRADTNSANADSRKILEGRLSNEIDRWRNVLVKRDSGVQAYEIRRFCDSVRGSLDSNIFFALARFYRGMPLDTQSQSKFDLVITRAFEGSRKGRLRKSKFNRVQITSEIRQLFSAWDEPGIIQFDVAAESRIIEAFNGFVREARALKDFESLVESNIFERVRDFKRGLGISYFQPECVAAAIECNLVIGNMFAELLSDLNADLHERLSSRFDFAAAFMDATVDTSIAMADLLCDLHVTGGESEQSSTDSGDMVVLRSLLRHATVQNGPGAEKSTGAPSASEPVQKRLAPELETLSLTEPDISLLRTHMGRSSALDTNDLNDFLFDESGRPDPLGRRALAAMVCLEEFKENDLKNNSLLKPEITDEMIGILNFAERVGHDLDRAIKEAEYENRSRLLSISNKLLKSHLRVERAVIRFAAPIEKTAEPDQVPEMFASADAGKTVSGRWFLAVTLFLVILFGSILLFSWQVNNAFPVR